MNTTIRHVLYGAVWLCVGGLVCATPVVAQQLADSVWYRLARADALREEGNYSDALSEYRAAGRLRQPLPEADIGIASVYMLEGLHDLAIDHLNRALQFQDRLAVKEQVFDIYYRLADIYFLTEQYYEYEQSLLAITATEQQFSDSRQLQLQTELVLSAGIDRLFELYRFGNFYTTRAHVLLGEHFVKSGNYARALHHLMFALVKQSERLYAINQRYALEVVDKTIAELVEDNQRFSAVRNESRSVLGAEYRLDMVLFYMGAAIYGSAPQSVQWGNVWSTAANLPTGSSSSSWSNLARARLQNPILEPLY